jgi:phospholipase/carboxylesterase
MPMRANVVEGKSLPYILVEPEGYEAGAPYPLVVLLHGFGANMYDLSSLSPGLASRGYLFAFPNAPYAIDLGGAVGYSWSMGRPGTPPPPEEGSKPDERLAGFLEEVMEQVGAEPGRVLLGGFSQGGGMTLRYGLPRPDVFRGLVVLSGAFRDSSELRDGLPPERDQPIFVAHGTYDPMVPVDRGRATKAFLEELGYAPEYHEYDMAHEISEEVIYDLQPWMLKTLAPFGER